MFKIIAAVLMLGIAARLLGQRGERTPTDAEIRASDLTVFADGSGLPAGSGSVAQGRALFARACAACHGPRGEGSATYPALVGGIGSLSGDHPLLIVGSYWPFAPTVFDFIRRAMPYNQPGTLTSDQVYALTAYVLSLNGIVNDSSTLNRSNLPLIRMPNRDGFVLDPRPDVKVQVERTRLR